MFSKEGKQRPVYQKHVPVLNLLFMVSDILLYILWSLILGYEYLAKENSLFHSLFNLD